MTDAIKLELTGEQNLVLTLPPREPVLIRGSAGSGKTTVAVYRARHLNASYRDLFNQGRVAVITYTNELVNYVRLMLSESQIAVTTLHKLAMGLIRNGGYSGNLNVVSEWDQRDFISGAIRKAREAHGGEAAILCKGFDFYKREIDWIKGRALGSLEAYCATPRTGRGTADRVTADDRAILWEILAAYNERLRATNQLDWHDVVVLALRVVSRPGYTPPFTHLVIDEAQDCTFAMLSLVSKLVKPETNSITLVGDAAQRIYQSGFSWSDTGIRVVGARSREFRKNYRNTVEITAAAVSLLRSEEERTDFTETELPERSGPKPAIYRCHDVSDEACLLQSQIAALPTHESVYVAAPTNSVVKTLQTHFDNAGFKTIRLRDKETQLPDAATMRSQRCVFLGTMNSVKGLQANHVFLCDIRSGRLPSHYADTEAEDISCARKLLYVGMTRAQSTLTITFSDEPSMFLDEIDPATIVKHNW